MDRKLLNENPFLGIKRYFHWDDTTDEFLIETVQDVEGIVERNKADYNDAPTGWGEGTLVARIPISIFHDLVKKGIAHDDAAMKRWLEDPDNRFFRTRPGRV